MFKLCCLQNLSIRDFQEVKYIYVLKNANGLNPFMNLKMKNYIWREIHVNHDQSCIERDEIFKSVNFLNFAI